MTSRFAEIVPPYHRRGNRAFSTANRWPDYSVFLCLEGHLSIFSVIETDPFCRVLLAVDFPGLRRSGSSPEIIDQAQDFPKQFPRHGNLGQLEGDIATMADDLGPDLDQLLPERRKRSILDLLGQHRLLLLARKRHSAARI